MQQNAYLLAKIGAFAAETEQHYILPKFDRIRICTDRAFALSVQIRPGLEQVLAKTRQKCVATTAKCASGIRIDTTPYLELASPYLSLSCLV